MCGTYKGVYISRNSGINWRRIPEINQNIGLFGFSILDSNNIFISSFGYGLQVTTNGGTNWIFRNEGLIPGEWYPTALFSTDGYTYMGTYPVSYLPAIYRRATQQLIPVIENNTIIPQDAELYQNYPNPFNPLTTIRFEVPRAGLVKISVFDVTGREVAVLVNETLQAGVYETTFDASLNGQGGGLTSGVYFCRMEAGSFKETKKLILLK